MTIDKTHIEPAPVELWKHRDPASTEMWRFLQHINATYNLNLEDYPGLYKWSVDNVADFWKECWHFIGITASQPFSEVGSFQYNHRTELSTLLRCDLKTCPFSNLGELRLFLNPNI
jgi:hypothetical protein